MDRTLHATLAVDTTLYAKLTVDTTLYAKLTVDTTLYVKLTVDTTLYAKYPVSPYVFRVSNYLDRAVRETVSTHTTLSVCKGDKILSFYCGGVCKLRVTACKFRLTHFSCVQLFCYPAHAYLLFIFPECTEVCTFRTCPYGFLESGCPRCNCAPNPCVVGYFIRLSSQ